MEHPPEPPRPKRRPRYSGKNPRKFEEKYKEHNPQLYPETVQKVLASGKTPAGAHRPILVQEILQILRPQPGEVVLDATLGYGGHSTEILPLLRPGGRLIGLDIDPLELPKTEVRLRALGFVPEEFTAVQANYAAFTQVLDSLLLPGANIILADLGTSSMQLDNPARGLSFKSEGPLDLRMNPQKGLPAWEFIAHLDQDKIIELLIENADEPFARLIAPVLVEDRKRNGLRTTSLLANAVRRGLQSLPKSLQDQEGDASIRRVFQAIRIAVNHEFETLEAFLRIVPQGLLQGGRVAILTFHSGEDRRVKRAFQEHARAGIYREINDDVIRPSPEEIRANPRASSAKLRWAIKA